MSLMTKATKKAPAKASKTPAAKTTAKPAAQAAETSDKIGKSQIVELIGTASQLSKKDAAAAFDAALEVIVESLKSGKTVGLPGIGTLGVKATAARTGVKPGTAEKIQIAAGKKVSFKVAADLKKSL